MSIQSPSFYQPVAAYLNGISGGVSKLNVPWVDSFDVVPTGVSVCVVTQPLQSAPGLYVLTPRTVNGQPSQTYGWKFALAFTDVCAADANGLQIQLYMNVNSSETFGAGTSIWFNGQLQTGLTISASPTGVWIVMPPATSGGITSLAAASDYTTAPLASANTSIANALATKVVGVGTFASTGALQTAFPAASNTGAIALVGSAAPFAQYTSNGLAWAASGGITTLAAASDYATAALATGNTSIANALGTKVTGVGTFASAGALQTAFPAAANTGAVALVGASAPYTQYISNGSSWAASGGGTPSTTVPNSLGSVAAVGTSTAFMRADAVIQLPTAAAVGAFSLPPSWDANANNPTLTSSTVPPGGVTWFTVSVAGTTNLDGFNNWSVGDSVYYGLDGRFHRIAGVPAGTGLLKPDGQGGFAIATAGVDYIPGPILLTGIPSGIAPAATNIGNNGALTFGINLPRIYSQGIWLYFEAGALYSGSLAGMYWCVMSSLTVGVAYNNYLSTSKFSSPNHVISNPGTLVPIVATGPGAYAGASGTIFMPGAKVPGGTMGNNGKVHIEYVMRNNNSAGTKTIVMIFGTTAMALSQVSTTTATQGGGVVTVRNRNATNSQISPQQQDTSVVGVVEGTNDTTVDQYVYPRMQVTAPADCVILETLEVLVVPGA